MWNHPSISLMISSAAQQAAALALMCVMCVWLLLMLMTFHAIHCCQDVGYDDTSLWCFCLTRHALLKAENFAV